MSKESLFRKRRVRRTAKQVLRHGDKAKRKHAHPSGRTGSIHSKNLGKPKEPT